MLKALLHRLHLLYLLTFLQNAASQGTTPTGTGNATAQVNSTYSTVQAASTYSTVQATTTIQTTTTTPDYQFSLSVSIDEHVTPLYEGEELRLVCTAIMTPYIEQVALSTEYTWTFTPSDGPTNPIPVSIASVYTNPDAMVINSGNYTCKVQSGNTVAENTTTVDVLPQRRQSRRPEDPFPAHKRNLIIGILVALLVMIIVMVVIVYKVMLLQDTANKEFDYPYEDTDRLPSPPVQAQCACPDQKDDKYSRF